MSKIDNGGPAFPLTRESSMSKNYEGMSLRDWFAGQAFSQAVLDYGEPQTNSTAGVRRDRGNPILPHAGSWEGGKREQIIARQAYRYADAMLAERAKAEPPE